MNLRKGIRNLGLATGIVVLVLGAAGNTVSTIDSVDGLIWNDYSRTFTGYDSKRSIADFQKARQERTNGLSTPMKVVHYFMFNTGEAAAAFGYEVWNCI